MKRGLFITGTDTGVGKTVVSSLLLSAMLSDKGGEWCPRYFKPVQTGSEEDCDTGTILELSGLGKNQVEFPFYAFKAPISPNRAADLEEASIDLDKIFKHWREELGEGAWIVEGAGGIEVPLNGEEKISHLIEKFQFPVVVVSSTRLGTINHTLLTLNFLKKRRVPLAGIVLVGEEDRGLRECLEHYSGQKVIAEIPLLKNINRETITSLAAEFFPSQKLKSLFPEEKRSKIWHPFTQHGLNIPEKRIIRGKGSRLFLENGDSVIDAISSWWVNLHGHTHPAIAQAIAHQATLLEHTLLAGLTHRPAEKLAQYLSDATQMPKVFYSDNGSTAVEVALKMAFQYQHNIGQEERTGFIALKNAYHGDTLGAMSVSGPQGFHQVFSPLMAPVDFVAADNLGELQELLETKKNQHAAMIVEPLIQGASGMKAYSQEYLLGASKLCREYGLLFICDEVFTGFYRTGKCFAYQWAGIEPDLICLSKGLTGGFLPLSATLATEKIYAAFLSQEMAQAFLHGHSYTANPIACAAALASWKLLQSDECQRRIQSLGKITEERIKRLAKHPQITHPRVLGTIGAVDVREQGDYFSGDFSLRFREKAWQKGVLLRPLGPVIYTVPPYSTSLEELHKIYDVIEETLDEC